MKLSAILRFELRQGLHNPSFYVYALLFFALPLLSMAGAAGVFGEGTSGVSKANSPLGIYGFALFFNKLLLFLLPAVVGASIYRDYASNFHRVLFSYPFSKRDYLLGKFLAGMVMVGLMSALVMLGLWLGVRVPGVNPAQVVATDGVALWQAWTLYLLPNLLVFGVGVFVVVAVSQNIYAGFIGVMVALVLREVVVRLTGGSMPGVLGMWMDPFGETATRYLTRHWTPTEQDTLPIPLTTNIVFNRLFWLAIAGMVGWWFGRWFSFSRDAPMGWKTPTARPSSPAPATPGPMSTWSLPRPLPAVQPRTDLAHWLHSLWRLSWTDFWYILRSGSFLSILVAGAVLVGVLLWQTNPQTNTRILPVTWVILGLPVVFFSLLIQGLTFLYAGMLVHRAKAARMDQLVLATPTPNWVFLGSKFLALLKMQLVLLAVLMVVGMGIQVALGYYRFEIGHYLFDLLAIHLLGLAIWAVAALWVQSLLTNPYLGLFVLILSALAISNLTALGIESPTLHFNQDPQPGFFMLYSDLSGHGHALEAFFWYKLYWGIFAVVLAGLALWWWPRELTHTFGERLDLVRRRWRGPLAYGTGLAAVVFVAFGGWLRQEEAQAMPAVDETTLLARFQAQFGALAHTPQPRITAVYIDLQLYPETQAFRADGHYTLVNHTPGPIDTVLVRTGFDEITTLSFSSPVTLLEAAPDFKFEVYQLAQSLAPGDSIRLHFVVKSQPNTWLVQHNNVLRNGTMLKSDIFPSLGYFGETNPPMPTAAGATRHHYQRLDSDLVDFAAVVSTSAAQTAIAPGYLQHTWEKDGRRFFRYQLDRPIKYVVGFNSGVYDLHQETHRGVDLRIYHHPVHTNGLAQLMDGLKAALDYHTTYFGEYAHRQAQVIEFSRAEGSYATTYGNCVPVSEMRFINDVRATDNDHTVDLAFYVAAHELAHQWWGNLVMPAHARGALLITEGIAEYLTAKVYERRFGKDMTRKFLRIQLDRYLQGRATSRDEEPALMHVLPDQSYLAYGKGAVAWYTLSEYLGEDRLNAALRAFLNQYCETGPPYPTSLDLLAQVRAATPDSLQYLVTDLFETPGAEKSLEAYWALEAAYTPETGTKK